MRLENRSTLDGMYLEFLEAIVPVMCYIWPRPDKSPFMDKGLYFVIEEQYYKPLNTSILTIECCSTKERYYLTLHELGELAHKEKVKGYDDSLDYLRTRKEKLDENKS